MTDPMSLGSDEPHPWADLFIGDLAVRDGVNVLEVGTKRWGDESFVSHHKAWVPHAEHYVMADVEAGTDVDVVTDAHDLNFVGGQFQAFIMIATLEHCRFPWVAAQEAFRVLAPGGLLYCQTHMAFMNHPGYGGDFTRWTAQGLSALFEWAGFETIGSSMTHRVKLEPLTSIARWNEAAASDAWLCVDWYGFKP